MTSQKLPFCLEDNKDMDRKEYYDGVNLLGSVKDGIKSEKPGNRVNY